MSRRGGRRRPIVTIYLSTRRCASGFLPAETFFPWPASVIRAFVNATDVPASLLPPPALTLKHD